MSKGRGKIFEGTTFTLRTPSTRPLVQGQNYTFALGVLQVLGQFSRWPCGVGTHDGNKIFVQRTNSTVNNDDETKHGV